MKNRRARYFGTTLFVGATASFLAVGLSTRDAHATTITVNTTNMGLVNDSKCGLAEALVAVNNKAASFGCPAGTGNDTIQLQATTYNALGRLTIKRGVTIKGAGVSPISGPTTGITASALKSADTALFDVEDDNGKMTVNLQNLRLSGPSDTSQLVSGIWANGLHATNSTVNTTGVYVFSFTRSGIFVDGFNANVQEAYFIGNSNTAPGGGLFFSDRGSNLTISQSTFSFNTSDDLGGGVEYDGTGTSSITNSTLDGNSSTGGGAIDIQGESLGTTLGSFAVDSCTIVNNNCESPFGGDCGGGILSLSGDFAVDFSVNASILAYNFSATTSSDVAGDGNITEFNSMIWEGGDSSQFIPIEDGGGNKNFVDPLVDPDLSGDGGPYNLGVSRPAPNSPALDYLPASIATDERGFPRGISRDGANHQNLFDIGAVEFDPNTQAETMGVVSSSASVSIVAASGFSDGKGAKLNATKTGDNVVFFNALQSEENYDVKVRFETGPAEGKVQLEWSTDPTFATGVQTIGPAVDLFAKTSGFLSKDFGVSIAMDPDDTNCFRFRVTGKNTSSTGFALVLDYVDVIGH